MTTDLDNNAPAGVDLPDPLSRFVEQMGLMCESENMPRIGGRLFGLFLVEGRPLSLKELADRLQVSRASVSTNARMLADVGILRRVGVPGDRQDYYELSREPFDRLLVGVVQRMRRMTEFLDSALTTFPPDRPDAMQRVKDLALFHRAMADAAERMAHTIAAQFATGQSPSTDDPI